MRILIAGIIFALCVAAAPEVFVTSSDRIIILSGNVARERRGWLVVECHNGTDWKQDGFAPNYTRVVSDYKPLFRKMPTGQWEIQFVSEIAENLP